MLPFFTITNNTIDLKISSTKGSDMNPILFIIILLSLALPKAWAESTEQECPKEAVDFEVIDMHTHAFNLRYLPVKGILYKTGIPKPLAGIIDKITVSLTGNYQGQTKLSPNEINEIYSYLNNIDGKSFLDQFNSKIETNIHYVELQKYEKELDRYIVKEILKEIKSGVVVTPLGTGEPPHSQAATLVEYFYYYNNEIDSSGVFSITKESRNKEIKAIVKKHGLTSKLLAVLKKALNIPGTIKGYLRTLTILMLREDVLVNILMEKEFCDVDIFVHHMMDLEKTYNDEPNIKFSEQIERSKKLSAQFEDKLIYFAAFDPFRRTNALALVEQAKQLGALGIKFYPPSGYRPSNTEIPKFKQSFWQFIKAFFVGDSELKKQWNSRYKNSKPIDIDLLNDKFFTFMEKNKLIVFSHHSMGGFEAGKDYGLTFGKPGYWGDVLNKHPKLKVVIAHSGGGEGWFGEFDKSFSQQAYNICVLYKNAYCDFGFSDEVFNPKKRAKFQQNLHNLINLTKATPEEAIIWKNKILYNEVGTAPWVYPITKKIVYGSDWMMVSRLAKQRDFIMEFNKVFTEGRYKDELKKYRNDFFAGNARLVLFNEK